MVRRYAHLAPNHLTEHARKIDDIFGDNVPLWNYRRNKEGVTRPAGFEPAAHDLEGRCSIQLS